MVRAAHRRRWTVVLGVLLAVALAGCGSHGLAYNADVSDLEGTWMLANEDDAARITLSSDGTYETDDWPRHLLCVGSPRTVGDLDWGDRLGFEGDWGITSTNRPYDLWFTISSPTCTARTSWYSTVWAEKDQLEMEVLLDSVGDPDVASSDEIVWIRKTEDVAK